MSRESIKDGHSVSHTSRWSVSLQALQNGLRHRQLDTVAVFLRNKEKLLATLPHSSTSASASDARPLSPEQVLEAGKHVHNLEVQQLDDILLLITSMVQENSSQSQLRHFTEQILHLSLEFIEKIVRNVISGLQQCQLAGEATPEFESRTERVLTKLTDYREEIKVSLSELQRARGAQGQAQGQGAILHTEEERELGCVLSDSQRQLVRVWKSLQSQCGDNRAVTVEGILNGEMPLLQKFLQRYVGRDSADLTQIIETGLEEALAFLHDRDISNCRNMFSNMGFDPDSKLLQICLYTPEKSLRQYIVTELIRTGKLSQEEKAMVQCAHLVETLYSCPSFEIAKVLQSEGQTGNWEGQANVKDCVPKKRFTITQACGDLIPSDVGNSETSRYCHVLLEWLRHWSADTKARVTVEQLMLRNDMTSVDQSLPPLVVWSYFCLHLDVNRIRKWIEAQHPLDGARVQTSDVTLGTWPYDQPITAEMLQQLEQCSDYAKNEILNVLARHGVFVPSEVQNLNMLIRRLRQIQGVIQRPLVVETAGLHPYHTLQEFHCHVIKYCVDNMLPELLYFYLDYWRLCLNSTDLTPVGWPSGRTLAWVDVLLHFRVAANSQLDPGAVFEASLASSRHLEKMNVVSIETLVEQGYIARAVATLVYNPDLFAQFVGGSSPAVRSALQGFPQVQQALFGTASGENTSSSLTVYNLLQGDAPFDISQLFGWQSGNGLASEDAPQTLPHFSDAHLVSKYGYKESLHFPYYLKQGRPCFAFTSFLSSQREAGVKALSWMSVQQAALQAHVLGLRHFTQNSVTAACVAFTELLGVSSAPLRLHLQVATCLRHHRLALSGASVGGDTRRALEETVGRSIAHVLYGCVREEAGALTELKDSLEAAITWDVDRRKLRRVSLEAGQKWTLALMFTRHHNMAPSTGFLEECATANNWLMFLAFSEIHQYQPNQLQPLLPRFPCLDLRGHLTNVLDSISVLRPRDEARDKSDGAVEGNGHSASEIQPIPNRDEQKPNGDQRDVSPPGETRETDLFSVLMLCEKSGNPWLSLCQKATCQRSPSLAVLAACSQGALPLSCLCSWIVATCPDDVTSKVKVADPVQWGIQGLTSLSTSLAQNSLEGVLCAAIRIFDPECCLLPFLQFYEAITDLKSEEECSERLTTFKQRFHKTRSSSSSSLGSDNREPASFLPLAWVEETISTVVRRFLETCQSPVLLKLFLSRLDEVNVTSLFRCPVLDVGLLYKVHLMTSEHHVTFSYVILGDKTHVEYKAECERVLDRLQCGGHFKDARVVAEILGLPGDDVTLNQLTRELQLLKTSRSWLVESTRSAFWKKCQDVLERHRVKPAAAANLFLSQTEVNSTPLEESILYQLAYDWLIKSEESETTKSNTYTKLWRSRIRHFLETEIADPEGTQTQLQAHLPKHQGTLDKVDLVTFDCRVPQLPGRVELTSQESAALDVLIGRLVDTGRLREASNAVSHFAHKSLDLESILTCLRLARGHLEVTDLGPDMRKLVSGPRQSNFRRASTSFVAFPRTGSVMSVSSLAVQQELEPEDHPVLALLQALCQQCTHGKKCACLILTVYKIGQVLKLSFSSVLSLDTVALLYRLLASDTPHRYGLAKALTSACGLQDSEIAGFLCDAVLEALQVYTGIVQQVSSSYGADRPILLQMNTNPGQQGAGLGSGSGIQELIQLCEDPSVLGRRLQDMVLSLASTNTEASQKRVARDSRQEQVLTVEVELLIYSHDCFTLGCDMEGISAVLRTARTIVLALSRAEEYSLMIRLLTGVARYSEMTYIFDLLKESHQFELLFRKGSAREDRLRLAILDYLKRFHPTDVDTYSMASLHFTQYRDIAQMLDHEAHKLLTQLKGGAPLIESSPENQSMLQTAIHYFSDAAESYVKENCLRHAQRCVKYARLVALQSHLLSAKIRVVALEADALRAFVIKHPKFYEAFIVCEAYGVQTHWAEALYQQAVKGGHAKYLADYRHHVRLTPHTIREVVDRYKSSPSPTKQQTASMKKVLSYCKDVQMTFKLANDLGFQDVVKELVKSDSLNESYLKDIGAIKS